MRPNVQVHLHGSEDLSDRNLVIDVSNLVATAVRNVMAVRYGAADVFDPPSGEPIFTGYYASKEILSITHITVQSPQAMLTILQQDFSDPDMACFVSVMPMYSSLDTEDDDD